ncbi:major facilitator superfamily domain-containing protein [Xylariaceae sp. FL0016]|nr:major facilitator superfamily domain-containing protein [Xylariaceae sp. FL0016]
MKVPNPHDGVALSTVSPVAPLPMSNNEETATSSVHPTSKTDDAFLVAFNDPHDEDNPKDWPDARKWAVTDILSATGFNRIMVSTIMAPALPLIAQELNIGTPESAMALSIYLLATAFGPLVIGPLSEIYGRKRVLHVSNVWFRVWNIACGFASTKEVLIASWFLAGFGASAIYALGGGVLGDFWRPEQRGRSLGYYLLIPLLGAAVGPIIGGFMAGRTTWRWMFWSTSIFQTAMIAVSLEVFRETYAPLILRRHLTTASASLFHPIIQINALIAGLEYGLLYIVLSSFSEVWTSHYSQPVELSGLHFIVTALGEVAGSQLMSRAMDVHFQRSRASDGSSAPESRLPLMLPGVLLGQLGLLMYGWTAQYRMHWAVVDVGIFVSLLGMQSAGMPLSAYVIDMYEEHASSALAATQFLRSLTAFLFPLFAPALYRGLGYGWGHSALATPGLLIGLPAPMIPWVYGAKLRAKAASSY